MIYILIYFCCIICSLTTFNFESDNDDYYILRTIFTIFSPIMLLLKVGYILRDLHMYIKSKK